MKTIIRGGAMLVALLLSSGAVAGSYWGIGLGNASYDIEPLGMFSVDDGTAFRVFLGKRDGNHAFEGEMTFAEYDWTGSSGMATHTANHLILSGVGFLPLGDSADLYGKLGINLWSTTVELLGTEYEGDDGIGIAFGGGLELQTTDKFHIRLEYQMMGGIGDGVDKGDISQLTVNGVFMF